MQSFVIFGLDDPQPLIDYLHNQNWLHNTEQVQKIAKAGEGNMNFVARIYTSERTLIFKQSRPWVEKYPQFEAPLERIDSEVAFYEAIQPHPDLRTGMPALLAFNKNGKCALFEDLGDVEDYASMYDHELAPSEEIILLIRWISRLHNTPFPYELQPQLANRAMRALNHAHLFDIPLQPDNGLTLDEITPGLQAEARRLQSNPDYCSIISSLGTRYMGIGHTLLHGDFYPASWVKTTDGPRVIDPEFTFFGPPEYDMGVCRAHLMMAGYSAEQIQDLLATYETPAGYEQHLADQFAGMEIMRRLIGVAQLPLSKTLAEKKELLRQSEKLVLGEW